MRKRVLLMLLMCGMAAPIASANVELLSLPDGDPQSGREVFVTLKCNTCHEVLGDKSMPKPIAQKPGPSFGVRQSRYKPNFIADSIIFPSHAIQPGSGGRNSQDGSSRMGDFSDSITIRQIADVVAYLKTLDEEV